MFSMRQVSALFHAQNGLPFACYASDYTDCRLRTAVDVFVRETFFGGVMKRIQLTLTVDQADAICDALDAYSRLFSNARHSAGIGMVRHVT
jgi:hypothetical protein